MKATSAGKFEQIQRVVQQNNQGESQPGAARDGQSLLAGLLRCRRCGRKLTVRYTGNGHDVLRYSCIRGWLDNGEPRCIAFGGITVDEAIGREVFRVVQLRKPSKLPCWLTKNVHGNGMTWSRHSSAIVRRLATRWIGLGGSTMPPIREPTGHR